MTAGAPRRAAIVFALDDRFIGPALVAIASIGRRGGLLHGVTLVVLTKGLHAASVTALEASARRASLPLSVRTIADTRELGAIAEWAVPTCLRLFVGDMCADFDRALYLDADMLVQSALGPLLDLDLGGRTAAAVVNYPPIEVMRVAIRRSHRGEADPDAPYFNAGVLLVDVAGWHRHSIGRDARAFLSRYPSTRLLDQDALNIALVHDWLPLERVWNAPAGALDTMPMLRGLTEMNRSILDSVRQWEDAQRHARILHFTGWPKPWDADYPWPDLRRRYFESIDPETVPSWPANRPQTTAPGGGPVRVREFRRA